ncbi:hypothetical protein LV164_007440 [Aspergillus fumigatus]|nr:hypothetical protein LV157_007480 [Aspergillus fumigatus]KAJ8201767.1 hypothetical protein LV164_007440 [Aspergillus fumigatus]
MLTMSSSDWSPGRLPPIHWQEATLKLLLAADVNLLDPLRLAVNNLGPDSEVTQLMIPRGANTNGLYYSTDWIGPKPGGSPGLDCLPIGAASEAKYRRFTERFRPEEQLLLKDIVYQIMRSYLNIPLGSLEDTCSGLLFFTALAGNLARVEDLVKDNAVNSLNVIHVSGTKGKGSTCAFTRAILRAHGMRTGFPKRIGLYTSPHLQCIRERIQLDDHPVPEDLFTKYFFEVWDCVMPEDIQQDSGVARQPRYLQFLALLAFHTFIREGVQAAIFEVHHGGEYDATNVIQSPVATGITSLGVDHVAQLGPTIEAIAWHKAGIFKPGAPAFSVNQKPGPADVMRKRALDKGTTLTFVSTNECLPTDGTVLSVPVQRLNCSLALELSRAFVHAKAPGHTISDEDICHGVESFSLTGRFEIINEGQVQWFVDGAHNVLSLGEAAEWFARNASNEQKYRSLIFSHLSEARDGVTLVRSLAHALFKNKVKPDHVIFTTYQEREDDSIDRVTEVSEARIHDLCALYCSVWKELDPQATVTSAPTIEEAVRLARTMRAHEDGMQALVTGSLYMVGGALRFLRPSPH